LRVLFLTQVVPYPLDAGPKVRAYYVLRHLAEAGHDITLVTFTRDTDRAAYLEHLGAFCSAVHSVPMPRSRLRDALAALRSLGGLTPVLIARDRVPAMESLLAGLARGGAYDVVHADQLWMAPYALHARAAATSGRPPATVLDQHNAVFQIPQRLAAGAASPLRRALLAVEARKLVRYERRACAAFDAVVWVTEEDREALRTAIGPASGPLPGIDEAATVIPICIDAGEAPPLARREAAHRVTFLGGLHWPPNADGILWFAREAWPRVRAAAPEAVLTVIGQRPPAEVRALAADGIEVTGYVPDLRPLLEETAVFLVPLHAGGGMRVKILDAWRWGLPVVTTTIGAEGIAVRHGEDVLVADGADAMAQAVLRVLRAPDLAEALRAGGLRAVAGGYHWRTVYRAWDDVYAQLRAART
jgi:glycosyltransferase involved in cell wall biosynthesis